MKNKPVVDDRLCSLLDLDREASLDDVFNAVQELKRDHSDANDTAGDLTHALVAIEEALGVPSNPETSPDPCLQAIEALKDERRGWELDYRQLTDSLDLDADAGQEPVIEAVRELLATQERGEANGRRFREAAGLDPHAPVERVFADVAAMRDERIALRRMLSLQADAASDVVFDAVDKLKRKAADIDLVNADRQGLRLALGQIVTELGLEGTGAVPEIIDVIRKLKPREAAMSNAAWLAAAWETLTKHLHIPQGASLQQALEVIDEAIDVRDRVVEQFDFSDVVADDPLGPVVEHRIQAQRAAASEVGERLAEREARLAELWDLHRRYCVAANIDPSYPPLVVQESLVTLRERRDALLGFAQTLRIMFELSSRASLEEVENAVRALRDRAALLGGYELLTERASAVSDLVEALTSANARLAVSIAEASR